MKKVVSILVLCLVAAAFVCSLVIPTQTQQFFDTVIRYANTPVAIAGISTTIGGLVMFVICKYVLTNTKFGRREIDSVKDEIKEAKEIVDKYKEEIINKAELLIKRVEELKHDCHQQVTIMYEEFNLLESNLMNALETIPNKKVQAIVSEYKLKLDERKQEVIEKTIDTNKHIDERIAELEKKFHEALVSLEKNHEKEVNPQTTEE